MTKQVLLNRKNFNYGLGLLQVWTHQGRRPNWRGGCLLGEHIPFLCKFIPVSDSRCCLLQRKTTSQTVLHKLWVIPWIYTKGVVVDVVSSCEPSYREGGAFLGSLCHLDTWWVPLAETASEFDRKIIRR